MYPDVFVPEDLQDKSDNHTQTLTPCIKNSLVFKPKIDNSSVETLKNPMALCLENATRDEKYHFVLYFNGDIGLLPEVRKYRLIANITQQFRDPMKAFEAVLRTSTENKAFNLLAQAQDIPKKQELEITKNEFKQIITSTDIADESSEIQFREQILNWFEKYKIFALESLWQYYKENKFSPALLSEILELVGIANLDDLDPVKIGLFNYIYYDKNLEVRHGVVEGVSGLKPKIAIPILENALSQEKNTVLKKTISSYIEQLKQLTTA